MQQKPLSVCSTSLTQLTTVRPYHRNVRLPKTTSSRMPPLPTPSLAYAAIPSTTASQLLAMTAPVGAMPPALASSRVVSRRSGGVGCANRGPLIVSARYVSKLSGSRMRCERKMRSGGGNRALVWTGNTADRAPSLSTALVPGASAALRSTSSPRPKMNMSTWKSLGRTATSPSRGTSCPTRK